jgi:linoleoyl-CoA desaturase
MQRVKFAHKEADGFFDVLKGRVNEYFQTNHISKQANSAMRIKTTVMLVLYFVPFLVMVSGMASANIFLFYGMWLLMGVGIVGIGACIMHDANHGSYAHSRTANKILGGLLNLIGGYDMNWRIQHNVLHHTYTNLEGLDEDINAGPFLRMSPEKPLRNMHKYQYLYAWFLYAAMNIYWVLAKDFVMLFRYSKAGLLKNQKITLGTALTQLIFIKVFYLLVTLVLPIYTSGMAWYHIVWGMVMMHLIAGFSLAVVFQPAHVVATSEFPVPTEAHKIENSWAVHQLLNTADFAPNNKLVSFFIGGLNYQIEHHLFPHICHIHYPALAAIVRQTAKDFDLPYIVMPTFRGAIREHGRMLYLLGRQERPEIKNYFEH